MKHIPQIFDIIFPKDASKCSCLFFGCTGPLRNWDGLRYHFHCQYWGVSLRILKERPTPFPKC